MAYLHIPNLYKEQEILIFKECFALEKIHGTSSHISFDISTDTKSINYNAKLDNIYCKISLFSGGEKHENFVMLFYLNELAERFLKLGITEKTTVFGEAYGGKCQGMKDTYGDKLKFIAFEVKVGYNWLSVPQAEEIVKDLGLEFVFYTKIPATIEAIDKALANKSMQALRNGMGEDKQQEGIVLRPLLELRKNNGERIIVKHKNEDFRETKKKRTVVDVEKLEILTQAKEIAEEWVNPNRLKNILSHFPENINIESMDKIIKTMIEDVKRESTKEVAWSKIVEKAIGRKTAYLMKEHLKLK